jgi:hypothetical protein
LHQAEVTGGWRIRRVGALLENKTINAYKFLMAMETSLSRFCKELNENDWDDIIWINVRKKIPFIINNCE